MKRTIAICAALLAVGLAAKPAAAQLVYPRYSIHPGYAVIPPYEALAIVRSTGLEPIGSPMRHGPTYVLAAIDDDGEHVRVVVDARLKRIVRVSPISGPRYAVPPPHRPPGRIPLLADDYVPEGRTTAVTPGPDAPPGPAAGTHQTLPGSRGVAAPPGAQAGPPPLPRPRPKVASADGASGSPQTSHAPARREAHAAPPSPPKATAEAGVPGPGGTLPPPMEE